MYQGDGEIDMFLSLLMMLKPTGICFTLLDALFECLDTLACIYRTYF